MPLFPQRTRSTCHDIALECSDTHSGRQNACLKVDGFIANPLMRRDSPLPGASVSTSVGSAAPGTPPSARSSRPLDSDDVLSPETSFAADPYIHAAQSLMLTLGCLITVVLLMISLPPKSDAASPIEESTRIRSAPWLAVFLPVILTCTAAAVMHGYYITQRDRAVRLMIGPVPDSGSAVAGAVLQHSVLTRVFTKQVCSAAWHLCRMLRSPCILPRLQAVAPPLPACPPTHQPLFSCVRSCASANARRWPSLQCSSDALC
jgi:hypothetical protein